jgi:hypothetical protein
VVIGGVDVTVTVDPVVELNDVWGFKEVWGLHIYCPPEGFPVAVIGEEVPEQMVGLVTVTVGV